MSEETLAERERIDIHYRVQVAYTVPVEVIVNLEKGTVDRVVVVPEGIALEPEEGAREESVLLPVPSAVARKAIAIAEGGKWPVWDHDF